MKLGGKIHFSTSVKGLQGDGQDRLVSLELLHHPDGKVSTLEADVFISTMPVRELVGGLTGIPIPGAAREIAGQLEYRDFLIVGILASGLSLENAKEPLKDNWLYIQDKRVMAGRVQFFHNWSPFLVNDPSNVWIGVEYFCNEPDSFWQSDDETIKQSAIREMEMIGVLQKEQVLDALVVKVAKAYPSYYGAYSRFGEVREALDKIENLYLVGRNGMHRYNNTDHSMLTAMEAVSNIISGRKDKSNIWDINVGDEYHERA